MSAINETLKSGGYGGAIYEEECAKNNHKHTGVPNIKIIYSESANR